MESSSEDEITPRHSDDNILLLNRDARSSLRKRFAVNIILASILFETIAFDMLATNVGATLGYNETLNWTDPYTSNAVYTFDGFPLYFIGFVFYALFVTGKTLVCFRNETIYENDTARGTPACIAGIYSTLILSAIGSAAFRINLIVFGVDQIQKTNIIPQYVDNYVIIINVAAFMLTALGVYLPDGPNYFLTLYTFSISLLCLCGLLLIVGRRHFISVRPYDSVLTKFIPVYRNAFHTWLADRRARHRPQRKHTNTSTMVTLDASADQTNEEVEAPIERNQPPSIFLDYANVVNNGKFSDRIVNDVKLFRNAILILVLVLPYRLTYAQVFQAFPAQLYHMSIGDQSDFVVEEATGAIFLYISATAVAVALILSIFIYDYLRLRDRSLTVANMFIISMCLAVVTMTSSGVVEIFRQQGCPGNQTYSDLTFLAQIPQYVTTGVAQLFGYIASFRFAFQVAPRSARALFVAFHFVSKTIGSYTVIAYTVSLSKTTYDLHFRCPTDSNYVSHYFNYFFLIAGLVALFLILFIACQRYFRITQPNQQSIERNDTEA